MPVRFEKVQLGWLSLEQAGPDDICVGCHGKRREASAVYAFVDSRSGEASIHLCRRCLTRLAAAIEALHGGAK